MKNDLEIAYKIYKSFIKNKGRRNLKAICFKNVIFSENSNLEVTVKLRQIYWEFSAYYLGYKRRREFNRPDYKDLMDLLDRTEKFLTRVNRIRQSNWFWVIPQFIEK